MQLPPENGGAPPTILTARYDLAEQGSLHGKDVPLSDGDRAFLTGTIQTNNDHCFQYEENKDIKPSEEQVRGGGEHRYALCHHISLTPKAKDLPETRQVAQSQFDTIPASPTPALCTSLHPDLTNLDEETLQSLSFDCTSGFCSPASSPANDTANKDINVQHCDLLQEFLIAAEYEPIPPTTMSTKPSDPVTPSGPSTALDLVSPPKSAGHPSNAVIGILAETYAKIDNLLMEASVQTNRSVDAIRKQYIGRFKIPQEGHLFNLYEKYFADFAEQEIKQSGIVNGSRQEYYENFMNKYSNLAKVTMHAALDYSRVLNKKETQAQRAHFFDKHCQKISKIALLTASTPSA
ncbi:hypothetical protein C0991_000510 [Blastosporella zonata]|nr:hypothetical protein C0991_000510 [Blastosporella zonata]